MLVIGSDISLNSSVGWLSRCATALSSDRGRFSVAKLIGVHMLVTRAHHCRRRHEILAGQ
jgi:hypothetical protein